ncbi:hypothetical protein [Streptomyces sirii]|uniref:hypothetical protein n=1 Tax=Streptomyces sirii TaxID=3127701 RepID=UPI003D3656DE
MSFHFFRSSFARASLTASTIFVFASSKILRTIVRVVAVAAAAPASEAPSVTGAAAWAIASSIASAMSCTITAIFITMTIVATTWSTMAIASAASAASSRNPASPANLFQWLLNPSTASPELAPRTVFAAVAPSDAACRQASAKWLQASAASRILSSSTLGHWKPRRSRIQSTSVGSMMVATVSHSPGSA